MLFPAFFALFFGLFHSENVRVPFLFALFISLFHSKNVRVPFLFALFISLFHSENVRVPFLFALFISLFHSAIMLFPALLDFSAPFFPFFAILMDTPDLFADGSPNLMIFFLALLPCFSNLLSQILEFFTLLVVEHVG